MVTVASDANVIEAVKLRVREGARAGPIRKDDSLLFGDWEWTRFSILIAGRRTLTRNVLAGL